MAIRIAKSGLNVNTNFFDGIKNSGRFEYSSPVRRRLDFLNAGFRLRSSNCAATSQSDYRHRSASGGLAHRGGLGLASHKFRCLRIFFIIFASSINEIIFAEPKHIGHTLFRIMAAGTINPKYIRAQKSMYLSWLICKFISQ